MVDQAARSDLGKEQLKAAREKIKQAEKLNSIYELADLRPPLVLFEVEFAEVRRAAASADQQATARVNLLRQAIADGSFKCTLEELRQMCVHYDCYDVPNFAANLKTYKQLFIPRKKGDDLGLSAPGIKQAASIIKAIGNQGAKA